MLVNNARPRDLPIYAGRGRIFDIEYLFYTTGERSSDWVGRERTDELRLLKTCDAWVIFG